MSLTLYSSPMKYKSPTTGQYEIINGISGRGIVNITLNNDYTLTISFNDNTSITTSPIRGATGNGIQSIEKTSTSGLTDTYTITYTDGNTTSFTIENGAVPSFSIGTVTEGATAAATITGTAANPVLNLVLPNANVPTNVSAFTNDAGYLTAQDITGKQDVLTFDSAPTAASTNPVTSAGIKTYVDTAVSNINTMKLHICTAVEYDAQTGVPTVQNPDAQTFYLVPGGDSGNLYIEWVYVDSAWERFGSADIEVPVNDVQVNGTSVLNSGIANVPIMSTATPGVAKITSGRGLEINTANALQIVGADVATIKTGTDLRKPITPNNIHYATFYGLTKAAGIDMSSSSNAVGTYTEEAKAAIKSMLGVNVDDVQVNGSSVVTNGVAEIPISSTNNFGVIKVGSGLFVASDNSLRTNYAQESTIKPGTNLYNPITPVNQHRSVFYGLSKLAGADLANETVTVGTYPDSSKAAIQSMLGVSDLLAPRETSYIASQAYAVGDIFTLNGKLYKVTTAIAENGAIVVQDDGETVSGTNAVQCKLGEETIKDVQVNGTSVLNNGVANVPIASTSEKGVSAVDASFGILVNANGKLYTNTANLNETKAGTQGYKPIVPANQHNAAFYGLAKAAGDTTQSQSSNAVGVYTDSAKAAIQHMLGTDTNLADYESDTTADAAYAIGELFMLNGKLHQATAAIAIGDTLTVGTNCSVVNASEVFPHDVQVNDTSVVNNGVANVPIAGTNTLGVVKVNGRGLDIGVTSPGLIGISPAQDANIKAANLTFNPITPIRQHISVFYGLAKAAGDTSQASSDNAVGTYTTSAKNAIHSMLGTADLIEVGFVEEVTGTTPSITGKANYRYNCGEVSTLSITPPAAGSIDVFFQSGSTATVLTVPSTVKWPSWFDPEDLDSNTIYELLITDATYGSVMTWAT